MIFENVQLGTVLTLTLLFSFLFFMLQRTESKYVWVALLVLVLPVGYIIYDWARFQGWNREMLIAVGLSILLNVAFWVLYGRRHPTGTSDSIKVIGMDDE